MCARAELVNFIADVSLICQGQMAGVDPPTDPIAIHARKLINFKAFTKLYFEIDNNIYNIYKT